MKTKDSRLTLWEKHTRNWEKCRSCGIGLRAKSHVTGKGYLRPDIVFVGDFPGLEDEVEGIPFVDPAGKLLNRAIHDARFYPEAVRPTVFYLNTLACRPCNLIESPTRLPTAHEITNCRPWILEAFYLLQPNIVVALGNIPRDWVLPHLNKNIQKFSIAHPRDVLRDKSEPSYQRYVNSIREVFSHVV